MSVIAHLLFTQSDLEADFRIHSLLSSPTRSPFTFSYAGLYSFYDPDAYFETTSLLYSGEPYLQDQVRQVLERSGSFLLPSGQLPHHFVGVKPVYDSIAGGVQTGPNTFWVKSCLQYARTTGNVTWLTNYLPTIRKAAYFCLNLVDSKMNLLSAPGSLMIDVFLRTNYTSDSNAMMVGFLREFADVEEFVGNVTGAAVLRAQADAMVTAMNARLWAVPGVGVGGDDHFVTQLNPDNSELLTGVPI